MSASATSSDTGLTLPVSFDDMEQVFNLMSEGILVIRADRSIAYANPAFGSLWRVPGELMDFKNDFALINHVLSQLAEPSKFIHEVERLYSSREPSADELVFKDGRLFSRRSVSIENPGSQPARIWIFADLTEAPAFERKPEAEKKSGLFGSIFKH
jgi:PAS domain-containing protein